MGWLRCDPDAIFKDHEYTTAAAARAVSPTVVERLAALGRLLPPALASWLWRLRVVAAPMQLHALVGPPALLLTVPVGTVGIRSSWVSEYSPFQDLPSKNIRDLSSGTAGTRSERVTVARRCKRQRFSVHRCCCCTFARGAHLFCICWAPHCCTHAPSPPPPSSLPHTRKNIPSFGFLRTRRQAGTKQHICSLIVTQVRLQRCTLLSRSAQTPLTHSSVQLRVFIC